jgi:hypothetical protein
MAANGPTSRGAEFREDAADLATARAGVNATLDAQRDLRSNRPAEGADAQRVQRELRDNQVRR